MVLLDGRALNQAAPRREDRRPAVWFNHALTLPVPPPRAEGCIIRVGIKHESEVSSVVPVIIETLVVGAVPAPSVVVLRPFAEGEPTQRVLPIWIGPAEATSIGIALEGSAHPRPMTHDLTLGLLSAAGASIDRVEITRVEGTTFFASIAVDKGEDTVMVDARPSDAIALAVRVGAPIYVEDDVMQNASFPYAFSPAGRMEAEMKEFHEFIESVSPEDFQG